MVKKLYAHPDAVTLASEEIWNRIVNKFGESAGADWGKVTAKRQARVEKIVRSVLKHSENTARVKPPR